MDNRGGVIATSGATVDQSRRTRVSVGGLVAIVAVIVIGLGVAGVGLFTGTNPIDAFTGEDSSGLGGKWTAFPDICSLGVQQIEFYGDGVTVAINGSATSYTHVDATHIRMAGRVTEIGRTGDTLTLGDGVGNSCTLRRPGAVEHAVFGSWTLPKGCYMQYGSSAISWASSTQITFNSDGTMNFNGAIRQYTLSDPTHITMKDDGTLYELGVAISGTELSIVSAQILSGINKGEQMEFARDCTFGRTG
jgi:hypothetical protein